MRIIQLSYAKKVLPLTTYVCLAPFNRGEREHDTERERGSQRPTDRESERETERLRGEAEPCIIYFIFSFAL